MQLHLSAERQAQLVDYAQRHGKSPEIALDEVLAEALRWDEADFQDTLEALREGLEDVRLGRTQSADEVFEELNRQHGLPR